LKVFYMQKIYGHFIHELNAKYSYYLLPTSSNG
jgi:hypothetical protein